MMEKRNKIYGHQARNVIDDDDDDEIKLKILANTSTTSTNFQEMFSLRILSGPNVMPFLFLFSF